MFKIANGINDFHPKRINWSYLKRGNVHLIHIKKKMKKNIFINITNVPKAVAKLVDKPNASLISCWYGKLYPPK